VIHIASHNLVPASEIFRNSVRSKFDRCGGHGGEKSAS
jgi:hypothetical protein